MKQKIVLKVQLDCDKCRSKALKRAAEAKGVSSVSLEGDDRDKLVVTGEVDAVELARVLKKKFRCVSLLSVEDVKKKEDEEDKKDENNKIEYCYAYCPPPPLCTASYPYYVVQDPYSTSCFIM